MRVLDKEEKNIYESLMKGVKIKKLRCWNHTAPEGFDKA